MYDKEDWVTCMHCENFKPLLCEKTGPITVDDLVPCVKLGINRKALDIICKHFVLRQGMHTTKNYPGKEKEQRKVEPVVWPFFDSKACDNNYNCYDRDEMLVAIKKYDMELARQIKELRKKKRVTVKKMAAITQLSLEQYKRLEKGDAEDLSSTDILLNINAYFGIFLYIPFEY